MLLRVRALSDDRLWTREGPSSSATSRSERDGQVPFDAGTTDQPEQLAQGSFFQHRVAQRQIRMDPIHVATSVTATIHVPRDLQIAQEAVCVPFRDIGSLRDLSHA
jgi:hypothetical protein